ncbi:hypothetical protein ANN_00850 [Periplaneta americana]|uniref:Uncharacterized protein n=1 Tax=Periplaneta americana TaxID=6978 RepID=A0ABQ8TTM3_PERAM|nr:hypothetical protein ANN_00850 [Periplaneta americana]
MERNICTEHHVARVFRPAKLNDDDDDDDDDDDGDDDGSSDFISTHFLCDDVEECVEKKVQGILAVRVLQMHFMTDVAAHRCCSRESAVTSSDEASDVVKLGLTLREEHRLRVFENKVLRKIFGAKRDEVTGELRKLHTTELHELYSSPDIIRNIKSRRLRWAGHVARMGESRNAYRVWLFNDTVSTTRLFSVDEIGDSDMVFGEMRPRIRHRLPGIHLTVEENLGKNPSSPVIINSMPCDVISARPAARCTLASL